MLETQFSFVVTANDGDPNANPKVDPTETTFGVLAFEGEEQISQPFEYRLVLSHNASTIDFGKLVNQNAVLTLKLVDETPGPAVTKSTTVVKGIVSDFQVTEELDNGGLKCEAILVPKLWRLGLFHRSRAFQDLTVLEIIDKLLGHDLTTPTPAELDANPPGLLGGVPAASTAPVLTKGTDYDYIWANPKPFEYPKREFVMQYQETDLAFLHRLLEDIGIYYFFENGKLIFTDVQSGHPGHPQHPNKQTPEMVQFAKPVGMSSPTVDRIYRFVSNESVVPKAVSLRDHDYESFSGTKNKSFTTGTGDDYARVGTYAEHGRFSVDQRGWVGNKGADISSLPDPVDAAGLDAAEMKRTNRLDRVASVRAEELEARRKKGEGRSNVTRLQAGHRFTLSGHFLNQADGDYLVTAVRHRYAKVSMKVRETITVPKEMGDDETHTIERTEENLVYENAFTCLPAAVQFRAPRVTPIPRVPGIMTAKVKGTLDANGGDIGAHLDPEGRYRVKLPFDPAPEAGPYKSGQVTEPSRPIRLAQPYAGKNYGIHFPNRDNVEMVFACLDGDPNRPIGLGVVPDPWKHTPVPNTDLKLGSQVPIAGDLTTTDTADDNAYDGTDFRRKADEPFYFDELKNVIRTQRGHQIVMDDNNGGANVGITIQTGTTDPEGKSGAGEKNKYWFTKMELGGYRVKSGAEQIIDGITEVVGYLTTLASRDLQGHAGLALGIGASVAEAGDYLVDTYGNTTPVGVNIRTDQAVNVKGANGVNISSPNLFGMFSTAFVGDEKSERINQHYLELITKTINSLVFQSVMNDLRDEYKEYAERAEKTQDKVYANPRLRAFFKWKKQFKKARVQSWALTLLQRSGVNISSAGELKMSSLVSASMVAGLGGVAIKSQGDIEQASKGAFEIDSHEGISISTKGRSYTKESGVSQALDTLSTVFPPLVTMIKAVLGGKVSKEKDKDNTYPIALSNESGDITFNTDHGGDIFAYAGGGGSIINLLEDGFYLTRSPSKIVSEVGFKKEDPDKPLEEGDKSNDIDGAKRSYDLYLARLKTYKDALRLWIDSDRKLPRDAVAGDPPNTSTIKSAIGSRIEQTDKLVDVFGKEGVTLSTDKANSKSYIKIDKDEKIEIKCGDASIVLDGKTGDIKINGKNITIDGKAKQGDVNIKGKNVTTEAQMDNKMNGMNVALNGKLKAEFKGKLTTAQGQMMTIKGSLTKVGS